MNYSQFEDIPVWQDARGFAFDAYKLTKAQFGKDFELISQFRRVALSVALNIAEGFERKSNKDFARFISNAKGSAGECRAILYLALDLKYLSKKEFDEYSQKILSISKQLSKFADYLIRSHKK